MRDKLKPCPFCGSPGKVHHEDDTYFIGNDWWVQCSVCRSHTDFFGNRKLAVQAWNQKFKADNKQNRRV